jgi:hypothetical protein
MKMEAKKAKSETMEKTSMDRWMKQLRGYGACHLGNAICKRRTAHALRGIAPAVCLVRHAVRKTG